MSFNLPTWPISCKLKLVRPDLAVALLRAYRSSGWLVNSKSLGQDISSLPPNSKDCWIPIVHSRRITAATMTLKRKAEKAVESVAKKVAGDSTVSTVKSVAKKVAGESTVVNPKRWRELNKGDVKEGPVIYW